MSIDTNFTEDLRLRDRSQVMRRIGDRVTESYGKGVFEFFKGSQKSLRTNFKHRRFASSDKPVTRNIVIIS